MSISLKLPTHRELANLSNPELDKRIEEIFFQWNEALKQGEDITEIKQIYQVYDHERLSRLKRVEKYLKPTAK